MSPHGDPSSAALPAEPGVTLDRVTYAYGEHRVLHELSLDLPLGSAVVLTGDAGSGKSTFLHVAAGLRHPRTGSVLHSGQRVDALVPSERFRRGLRVGFVFQEGGLLANQTARDNVALPLRYHADVLAWASPEIDLRVDQALDRVGVSTREARLLPAQLSVGQRRRVALARALVLEPRLFFLDDPDLGLDPSTARLIHQVLDGLRDDANVTLVVATVRPLLIERLAVPTYRLLNGTLQPEDDAAPWSATST